MGAGAYLGQYITLRSTIQSNTKQEMSTTMLRVQSQGTFPALHVVEVDTDDWMNKLVVHEAFSGIDSTKSEPLRHDSKSSHCHEDGFNAILDAWNAYILDEIERTRNDKSAVDSLATTSYCRRNSEQFLDPLKRINNSGPPQRFRRRGAMWKAITSRMMEHAGVVIYSHGT